MKRALACAILAVLVFPLVACSDSDTSPPQAAAETKTSTTTQRVVDPVRYPGLVPSIAATDALVLSSDNSFPSQFELHRLPEGTSVEPPISPIDMASTSINTWGDDFIVVGRDCSTSKAIPNEELVCQPGNPVVQRFDPKDNRWTTISRGQQLGSALHGLTSFVKDDQVIVVSPLNDGDSRGHSVVQLSLPDGKVKESTETPHVDPTTKVTASIACLSGDRLMVLEAVSEQPADGQIAVHTLDLPTGKWDEATRADLDLAGKQWVQNPACLHDGPVVFYEASDSNGTLSFLDDELVATDNAPSGELSQTVPMSGTTKAELWVAGTLWHLDEKTRVWRDTGVHTENLAAVTLTAAGTAQLTYESGFDTPVSFSLAGQ